MPSKKKKTNNSGHNSKKKPISAKRGLIRDIATQKLMIIPLTAISTEKGNEIGVGLEVSYQTKNCDDGRGLVLMISSQEECVVELNVLEAKEIRNEETTDSTATVNNQKNVDSSSVASTGSELVGTITNSSTSMEIEDTTTQHDVINNGLNACEEGNAKDIVPNNETSSDSVSAEPQNNDPNITINEINNGETITENCENETPTRSTSCIENQTNGADHDTDPTSVIAELLRESRAPIHNSTIRTSFMSDRTNNPINIPCETEMPTDGNYLAPLNTKRSSGATDEATSKKRSKTCNNDNLVSHEKYLALRKENEQLKRQIEEMKATMIPIPNQTTIDYFTAVVKICNGQSEKVDDDSETLQKLSDAIGLSKDELNRSVDPKSIRKTCRNVLRKAFKTELANPKIPYSQVLSNEQVMAAIRDFGRFKHPREATKFSNGELNNALGNDFYQRDRVMRSGKQKKRGRQ